MGIEDNLIQRGLNHTLINQRVAKAVGLEAIKSSAKIIQNIADNLQIPEEVIIRKIKSLKHRTFFNMDSVTRAVLNSLLKVPDTHNYLEDYAKERDKSK